MTIPRREYTEERLAKWFAGNRDCRKILHNQVNDWEYLSNVAHTKRFIERFVADTAFRSAVKKDPRVAASKYSLRIDPEEIRPLWDTSCAQGEKEDDQNVDESLSVRRYRAFLDEKRALREKIREDLAVPSNETFCKWRDRQINRCMTLFPRSLGRLIVHVPLAIELTKGCSVGCWFCGFSAEKKEADFLYSKDNARLWRDILIILKAHIGRAAALGVCYHATEPFDNRDYELFISDYARIMGVFPETTTALAHKQIDRARGLIRTSEAQGCSLNRFSVLTRAALEKIHTSFTAEELLFTDIVPQNEGSMLILSRSGRALHAAQGRNTERGSIANESKREPTTIGCVTGYLVNMVERSLKLITPCPSSRQWPQGYWVLEEARFETSLDFERLLLAMTDRNMRALLRPNDPAAFRPDLEYSGLPEGFSVKFSWGTTSFKKEPRYAKVGKLLCRGDLTVGEIARRVDAEFGPGPPSALDILNRMFALGFLHEDPVFFSTKKGVQIEGQR